MFPTAFPHNLGHCGKSIYVYRNSRHGSDISYAVSSIISVFGSFKQTWQKCARRDRNYVCGQITDLSCLIGLDELMAPTQNSPGIQCEVPISRGLAKLGAFQVV